MALVSLREGDPTRIGGVRRTAWLGAGGMGVVYLGEAKGTGRVAIKVIRPEAGDEDEFRARFRREVALLARVQGLCTVRVVEADTESTSPFLVTEYADGPSLSEYVKRSGPLGSEMLAGLATGLAEALVAIHRAGVVHRDLKPGNVILTQAGPKVIDFGIAQALDGTVMTRTGMSMGSPGFMAPEQITGAPGQAADIFSWGLTVAYAASGRQPFGSGPAEVLPYRIVHGSPDIADVPDVLRPLVEAAVAKNPSARPTAGDLLAWLTAAVAPAPVQDAEPEDEDSTPTQFVLLQTWQPPVPLTPAELPGDVRRSRLRSRTRSRSLLAGAVALTTVIGAGVAYAIDSGTSQTPTGAQTGQAAAGAAVPTVTFGSYTGRKPFAIVLNTDDGGGTIQDIRWTTWTAAGASGTGELGTVPARVELSAPVNGHFTRIGETASGALSVQLYPGKDWPSGATGALAAGCTDPTSVQLVSAFNSATATVQDGWAAAGANLYGFDDIECWKVWVVADASGSGNGNMVFSTLGGLHLMPTSDMQQFSATVCGDSGAPKSWKGPDTGLAGLLVLEPQLSLEARRYRIVINCSCTDASPLSESAREAQAQARKVDRSSMSSRVLIKATAIGTLVLGAAALSGCASKSGTGTSAGATQSVNVAAGSSADSTGAAAAAPAPPRAVTAAAAPLRRPPPAARAAVPAATCPSRSTRAARVWDTPAPCWCSPTPVRAPAPFTATREPTSPTAASTTSRHT